MKPLRAYLSGGMEYADGEGARWRMEVQSWLESTLHHSVFNPNVESDRFFEQYYPSIDIRTLKSTDVGAYTEIVRKLVEIDCNEIASASDYVICYWDEGAARGAGTKGELTMAKFLGKPVFLVTAYPLPEIPGWVLACTTRTFKNFEELRIFLCEQYGTG
jgi:hypothetical protein